MMKRCMQVLLLSVCASVIGAAQATPTQATTVVPSIASLDKYTPDELSRRAERLKQAADKSGAGSASEVLAKYPGHFTMLAFRNRSGAVELHENYADIDVVLDGSATLITGGKIVDAKNTADGEVRGRLILDGQTAAIHKGDIFHIPANTAHQMLIPAGGSLTYFVIKAFEPGSQH